MLTIVWWLTGVAARAILCMDHKVGLIRVMDEKCTSNGLAYELTYNTKPYIVDAVVNPQGKRFAAINDEAHSSTLRKDMQVISQSLGSGDREYEDADNMISDQIKKSGKQSNISMFVFQFMQKKGDTHGKENRFQRRRRNG